MPRAALFCCGLGRGASDGWPGGRSGRMKPRWSMVQILTASVAATGH